MGEGPALVPEILVSVDYDNEHIANILSCRSIHLFSFHEPRLSSLCTFHHGTDRIACMTP